VEKLKTPKWGSLGQGRYMLAKNPYAKYANNKINTASGEELTLMLYDGALKFCNQAIIALENNNIEKANNLLIRVQDILQEFQITLDRRFPISEELFRIYDFLIARIMEANLKKDIAIIEEVLGFIRQLRETWKQAMLLSRKQQST